MEKSKIASDPIELAPTSTSAPRTSDVTHAAAHAKAAPELIRRLKSIEGHIRGVQKMVQADAYCIVIGCSRHLSESR